MNTSICETCGAEIHVGSFPFCPHEPVSSANIIDDTLPGGARWMHNLGPEPVFVSTKSEYKAELAQRGLMQVEREHYNRHDASPWATRTRLKPGQRDPFLHKAE